MFYAFETESALDHPDEGEKGAENYIQFSDQVGVGGSGGMSSSTPLRTAPLLPNSQTHTKSQR